MSEQFFSYSYSSVYFCLYFFFIIILILIFIFTLFQSFIFSLFFSFSLSIFILFLSLECDRDDQRFFLRAIGDELNICLPIFVILFISSYFKNIFFLSSQFLSFLINYKDILRCFDHVISLRIVRCCTAHNIQRAPFHIKKRFLAKYSIFLTIVRPTDSFFCFFFKNEKQDSIDKIERRTNYFNVSTYFREIFVYFLIRKCSPTSWPEITHRRRGGLSSPIHTSNKFHQRKCSTEKKSKFEVFQIIKIENWLLRSHF